MASYTVFANFFIDTNERFVRARDSFVSFYDPGIDNWVINIRGRYKFELSNYLNDQIKTGLEISYLSSEAGWFEDSQKLLYKIKHDYLFIWIEDHILINTQKKVLNNTINEMRTESIDHLCYTFWNNGLLKIKYSDITSVKGKFIDYGTRTEINTNQCSAWIISLGSIISKELFSKLVSEKMPSKEAHFSNMAPFNFEKDPSIVRLLPLKVGIPNRELFAAIDDDDGIQGYSLISRGYYPSRELRHTYNKDIKSIGVKGLYAYYTYLIFSKFVGIIGILKKPIKDNISRVLNKLNFLSIGFRKKYAIWYDLERTPFIVELLEKSPKNSDLLSIIEFNIGGKGTLYRIERHSRLFFNKFSINTNLYEFDVGGVTPSALKSINKDKGKFTAYENYQKKLLRPKLFVGDASETYNIFCSMHPHSNVSFISFSNIAIKLIEKIILEMNKNISVLSDMLILYCDILIKNDLEKVIQNKFIDYKINQIKDSVSGKSVIFYMEKF